MTVEEFKEFVNKEPEGVRKHESEGYDYIPIAQIEVDLDYISPEWSTYDMKYAIHTATGKVLCTLQLELPVRDEDSGNRVLLIRRTGAISFNLEDIQEEAGDPFAVAKSLCIKNAVRSVGRRFGRELNRSKEDEGHVPGHGENQVLINSIYQADKKELDKIVAGLTKAQMEDTVILASVNSRYDELKPKSKRSGKKKEE